VNDGQKQLDTRLDDADIDRIHALLSHYARQLWDLQKQRIGAGNRVAAHGARRPRRLCRAGPAVVASTRRSRSPSTACWSARPQALHGGLDIRTARHRPAGLRAPARGDRQHRPLPDRLEAVEVPRPARRGRPRAETEKGVPWTHTDCTFGHLLTCKPDCTTDHHPNCVPGGIGNGLRAAGPGRLPSARGSHRQGGRRRAVPPRV
jgi:hypothetical protein